MPGPGPLSLGPDTLWEPVPFAWAQAMWLWVSLPGPLAQAPRSPSNSRSLGSIRVRPRQGTFLALEQLLQQAGAEGSVTSSLWSAAVAGLQPHDPNAGEWPRGSASGHGGVERSTQAVRGPCSLWAVQSLPVLTMAARLPPGAVRPPLQLPKQRAFMTGCQGVTQSLLYRGRCRPSKPTAAWLPWEGGLHAARSAKGNKGYGQA